MNCPNCQNEVPESAKVCGYCGRKLAKPGMAFCTNCGEEIPAPAKVCGYCGTRQEQAAAAAPVPPPVIKKEEGTTQSSDQAVGAAPAPKAKLPGWVIPAGVAVLLVVIAGAFLLMRPKTAAEIEAPVQTVPTQPEKTAPPAPEISAQPVTTAVKGEKELLYDDFSKITSGWPTFGDIQKGEVGYAGGAYRFVFHNNQGFNAVWSPQEYDDCVVETEIIFPDNKDIGAGLTLRTTPKNWYLVFVYPNSREFSFIKVIDGQETAVIQRQFSEAIATKYADNRFRLKVRMSGSEIEIFIGSGDDYALLTRVNATELARGYLGPAAIPPQEAFTNNPAQVFFDWIRVSAL